jgi:ABC-2 type transport system ATP-binding protein
MVSAPRLLILDEPTVGLDPAQRAGFRRLLETVMESTSVLLSTHLVEDVSSLFDHVLVLDSGRVAFCGPVIEFVGGAGAPDARVNAPELERAYLAAVAHDE